MRKLGFAQKEAHFSVESSVSQNLDFRECFMVIKRSLESEVLKVPVRTYHKQIDVGIFEKTLSQAKRTLNSWCITGCRAVKTRASKFKELTGKLLQSR